MFFSGAVIPTLAAGLNLLSNNATNRQNNDAQAQANAQNYESQKEFAQMGLQWKTADAKAAGLHPMAALGASGASFSPSFQAGQPNSPADVGGAINSLIDGQNTKRAQAATQTETERKLEQLALERAQLQNRLLEGQVQNEWASLLGAPPQPSFPSLANPQSVSSGGIKLAPAGRVESVPSKSISSVPGDQGIEAGGTPGFRSFGITPTLRAELPGNELSQSLESMGIAGHVLGPVLSAIRGTNKLLTKPPVPNYDLPPGTKWVFDPFSRTYSIADIQRKPIHRRDKPPLPPSRGGATGSW